MGEIFQNLLLVLLAPFIAMIAAPIIILFGPFFLIAKCLKKNEQNNK